jgi:hypothetical protein
MARAQTTEPICSTMAILHADQLAAISRLFSSSVIRELARRGKSPVLARLTIQSGLSHALPACARVYDLFEAAFSLLKQEGYRHEYIYKAAITRNILLGKHSLRTASMLSEFRVGDCKADLAILNGTATVYEIKSERDSLSRLQRQIAAYRTVFASIYVVAAKQHCEAVLDGTTDDIGVLRLDARGYIAKVRDAREQADRTDPAAIFDSMRSAEARRILISRGISVPDVPNTERNSTLRKLFVRLSPRDAHEGMVEVLKQTRNLMPLSALVDQLPRSLHTAALLVPLRRADHARLVSAINTQLRDAANWN